MEGLLLWVLLMKHLFLMTRIFFLLLLLYVLVDLVLLLVKDSQTVLNAHLSRQVVTFAKPPLLALLGFQLEWSNARALQPLFQTLERLRQGQKHQDTLKGLQQVFRILILPRQLNSEVDEARGFD